MEEDHSQGNLDIRKAAETLDARKSLIKPDLELISFADRNLNSSRRHEKSGVTLASSGSSKTIKRVAKRYQKEQRIVIFEDGQEMWEKTPCFTIELNSLLLQYYLQRKGSSSFTTQQEDIVAQIEMYRRAVKWILDQCGSRLCLEGELTPEEQTLLDGAAPKRFNTLYTVYGETIQSLIQIEEGTCIMIAGDKSQFIGLKTSKLF